MKDIKRFLRDEEGVTMAEYALMAALIAAVCAGIVSVIGTTVMGLFQSISGL